MAIDELSPAKEWRLNQFVTFTSFQQGLASVAGSMPSESVVAPKSFHGRIRFDTRVDGAASGTGQKSKMSVFVQLSFRTQRNHYFSCYCL